MYPKITEILNVIPNYDIFIQVRYFDSNFKCTTSGIMKLRNVTYKHLRFWTYKKHVWKIVPCYKKGQSYLYIQLEDDKDS